MAKFTTDAQTLEKLHKTVTVKGNKAISGSSENFMEDYYFDVSDGSISVKGISPSDDGFVRLDYDGVDVQEEGQVSISNIDKFKSVLSRFENDEELQLEDDGDILTISSTETRKEFKIKSTDHTNIDSYIDTEGEDEGLIVTLKENEDEDQWEAQGNSGELLMDRKVTLDIFEMKEVIEDAQVIQARDLPFKLEDGDFTVDVKTKRESIDTDVQTKSVEGDDAEAKYQKGLHGIFTNLEGEVEVYFNTDTPAIIRLTEEDDDETLEVTYLIAPKAEAE